MAAGRAQHPLHLVVEEEPQDNAEDDQALQLEQSATQDDRFEATELARLRSNYSRVSRRSAPTIAVMKPATLFGRLAYNVKKFWKDQIMKHVETIWVRRARDLTLRQASHLSNFLCTPRQRTALTIQSALERTFLGYLRTSLALSMMGITVAQLFRLQHNPAYNTHFGFFVLGKPLSCICQGAAIYTLIIGCFRTWRSQNAIVRGKAISGGFEIVALALGIFLPCSPEPASERC
ncbi:hypothetical protein LOCC1_G008186 [Lachnellula occidentalis]|uniref:DUF202 domain-containing protein n=1 Tax=Lachnellula occidentalis TaxID=215460 RepID=A0A8H8RPN3_9HELO|nr:hypothetical protein LOCC1_G008186 [Lachnellula occidentalis]